MDTVEILGYRAKVARTFPLRAKGLIGTRSLAKDEGMLVRRCSASHAVFMRFPIDATFLDRQDRVVRVGRHIRPWRLFVWGGWRAVKVLETASCPAS